MTDVRVIAFHLPQFHPIPENDLWWGRGFTEWTNVTQASPLFRGHRQPKLPADLGFYDLRLGAARQAQADLARAWGIEAFCYWHYWFHGARLLQRPVNAILEGEAPDFPFCLAWANEPWSRRWLGEAKDVLQDQRYSAEDDVAHAEWLAEAFSDPRYLRVGDRPVFLVYRAGLLPDPAATVDRWRERWSQLGLPDPLLLAINTMQPGDLRNLGFDATVEFQPRLGVVPYVHYDGPMEKRLLKNLRHRVPSRRLKVMGEADFRAAQPSPPFGYPGYGTVLVDWDNTPRRGIDGIVVVPGDRSLFRDAVARAARGTIAGWAEPSERLLFVNAWNEWAEGNFLEPDLERGTQRLEDLRDGIQLARSEAATSSSNQSSGELLARAAGRPPA